MILSLYCVVSMQDYYIVLDTNLPSHFYRFTRPEATVPGSEDFHITLTFNVEVCVCLFVFLCVSVPTYI